MDLSPWETDSRLAGQEIPRILWDSKVNYRAHKNPPLDLSRANWM
jgi:hypothetical protein